MRKHFLMLFLMALLPLAGWAGVAQFSIDGGRNFTNSITTDQLNLLKVYIDDVDDVEGGAGGSYKEAPSVTWYHSDVANPADWGDAINGGPTTDAGFYKATVSEGLNNWEGILKVTGTPQQDVDISGSGNIGVQLSTTMTKEFGDPDPEFLAPTDFVIISDETGENLTTNDLVNSLKFQRSQDNEGEDRGRYQYEVTVSAEFAEAHPTWHVVATNSGVLTITEKALNVDMIGEITDAPFTFKAAEWQPKPAVKNGETALKENTDFTYTWADNINAGTGKVIIKAVDGGNYSGTAEKTFTINKREVTAENLLITYEDEFTYQGVAIKPVVTVKDQTLGDLGTLVLGSDYTVNYYNNTNATSNEAPTRLKVKMPREGGNYSFADANKFFTIKKAPLTISIPTGQKKVYGEEDPELKVKYDGFVNEETAAGLAALEPAQFVVPQLTRVAGDNAGVYAISITNTEEVINGASNYDVTISDATVNFSIQAKDIANVTITLTDKEGDNYKYNGEEHFKNVAVAFGEEHALEENIDYTVATTENINAGENTAIVTVTGKNNYKGTKTANFSIEKAEIAIIPEAKEMAYGATEEPALTYTLKVGDETVDNDVLNGTVTLQREPGSTVGSYKIWFESYEAGETADNYTPVNTETKETEVENNRYALFTITGSEETLYLKFKEGTIATKVYGDEDPVWSIDDLEVDTEKGGAACDDWDAIKYSFGDPEFAIASENVEDNETNFVSVSNQLTSPIYPTVVVATMPFTITAKPITVTLNDQAINYGGVLGQEYGTNWSITEGRLAGNEAPADLGLVVKTVNDQATYAVSGDAYEKAITAVIDNKNYELTVVEGNLTVNGIEALAMRSVYADDADDEFTKIKALNGQEVNVTITVNRTQELKSGKKYTWKGEDWNAFILPFDITPKELSDIFGYAIVNVVNPNKSTEDNIAFSLQMSGTIAANTPFMLKNYQAVAEDAVINFGPREIVAPESEEVSVDAGAGWTFIGSYKTKTIDNNNTNVYYYNGEGAWKHLGATSTNTWNIAPFNAYMLQPAGSPAREITFTFEDLNGNTTAIKSINEDSINTNVEGWYNLNGMKMDGAPVQKGIYIKDGKKVVIK